MPCNTKVNAWIRLKVAMSVSLAAAIYAFSSIWKSFPLLSPPMLLINAYWVLCMLIMVMASLELRRVLNPSSKDDKRNRNIQRKLYHAFTLVILIPIYVVNVKYLAHCLVFVLLCFVCVELMRVSCTFPMMTKVLNHYYEPVLKIENETANDLVWSHVYLLMGVSFPIWLEYLIRGENGACSLRGLIGLITVGIGDSTASLIGICYGRYGLSSKNGKTYEGLISSVASMALAFFLLHRLFDCKEEYLGSYFATSLFAGLVESYASYNDNMIVPLVSYVFHLASEQFSR